MNTPALARRLGINIDTADIKRITCKNQYILARSKEQLEEKIKTYKEKLNSNSSYGKFKKNPRLDEIIKDIENGMDRFTFCAKYSLSRDSYSKYRRKYYFKR